MAKKNFYAVAVGRKVGVFPTWAECEHQVKGFKNARFKGFKTKEEAEGFLQSVNNNSANQNYNGGLGGGHKNPREPNTHHVGDIELTSAPPKQPPQIKSNYFSIGNRGAGSHHLLTESKTQSTQDAAVARVTPPQPQIKGNYSSFALRQMERMGHTPGSGLGKRAQGITSPIQVAKRPKQLRHAGVGIHEDDPKKLNEEQLRAVRLATRGRRNVFVTGPAGTGKSVVLRQIKAELEQICTPNEMAVVAPTGTTAVDVGGQTLHSFAGCGVPVLKEDFAKCWDRRDEWRDLKYLLIDEISMFSGEFLERLSDVVRDIRNWGKEGGEVDWQPFGEIQLIFFGDFLQLPPIPKKIQDIKAMKKGNNKVQEVHCDRGFAFQSRMWREANFEVVQLKDVYRQGNHQFQEVLHDIRKGNVTPEIEHFLQKCNRPLPGRTKPTILYAKNKDVTAENMEELLKLPGHEILFEAKDSVVVDPDIPEEKKEIAELNLLHDSFFWHCLAEETLHLKKKAQVMLIQNEPPDEEGKRQLVNGSRGVVEGFEDEEGNELDEPTADGSDCYPVVKFKCGERRVIKPVRFSSRLPGLGVCVREAIPLKLAWAVTIHKSQGMTLDCLKADLSEVFAEAQTYVALSRAKDENALELRGFSKEKVRANKRALAFYQNPNAIFPTWDQPWDQAEEAMNDTNQELVVPPAKKGCLQGLAFVLTGEPIHLSRDGAENLIKDCGGIVRSAVSGKTNYLVIGTAMEDGRDVTDGGKYQKAKQIMAGPNKSKLKILNEADFYTLIVKRSKQRPVGLNAFFKPKNAC